MTGIDLKFPGAGAPINYAEAMAVRRPQPRPGQQGRVIHGPKKTMKPWEEALAGIGRGASDVGRQMHQSNLQGTRLTQQAKQFQEQMHQREVQARATELDRLSAYAIELKKSGGDTNVLNKRWAELSILVGKDVQAANKDAEAAAKEGGGIEGGGQGGTGMIPPQQVSTGDQLRKDIIPQRARPVQKGGLEQMVGGVQSDRQQKLDDAAKVRREKQILDWEKDVKKGAIEANKYELKTRTEASADFNKNVKERREESTAERNKIAEGYYKGRAVGMLNETNMTAEIAMSFATNMDKPDYVKELIRSGISPRELYVQIMGGLVQEMQGGEMSFEKMKEALNNTEMGKIKAHIDEKLTDIDKEYDIGGPKDQVKAVWTVMAGKLQGETLSLLEEMLDLNMEIRKTPPTNLTKQKTAGDGILRNQVEESEIVPSSVEPYLDGKIGRDADGTIYSLTANGAIRVMNQEAVEKYLKTRAK